MGPCFKNGSVGIEQSSGGRTGSAVQCIIAPLLGVSALGKKDKPKESNHKTVIIYLLLGCLSFAVYVRVIGCGFLSIDDNGYVTENRQVQGGISFEGIKWAFTASHCANWHPVTWISHMLDCRIFVSMIFGIPQQL